MVLIPLWVAVAAAAPRDPVVHDVVVAAGIGGRTITSHAVIERVGGRGEATFRTLRTRGTWEESGHALAFDSDRPTDGDPWYLRMQHVVASVPARVRLDEADAPVALVAPDRWTGEVRARLYEEEVPVQALQIAEALVDADGLVRDLARSFPGVPVDGPWARTERIAGLDAERIERCTVARTGRTRTWTCEGTATGPSEGPGHLHGVTTRTTLERDRRGWVRIESTWSGTLVVSGPDGSVVDRPIAERRLVRRR